MTDTVVLTKTGPRLIDIYRDVNEVRIIVNGPGMLYEKLEFMTNRSAIDGATFAFYEQVAANLEATVDCPHAPVHSAKINVASHRVGAELSVDLGPISMYQSELRIRTVTGGTFRALIDDLIGDSVEFFGDNADVIAVFVAVRATGHHEQHTSAPEGDVKKSAVGGRNGSHSNHHQRQEENL